MLQPDLPAPFAIGVGPHTEMLKHDAARINGPGPEPWRQELQAAYRDPLRLIGDLELGPDEVGFAARAVDGFAFRVPRPFASRMRKRDPHDPLLRQVLPTAGECTEAAGFTADPVGDRAAQRVPGLLCKYAGRALLLVHGACAIHCRYCFRRHFPYQEATGSERWRRALDHIGADAAITEVILSGGDPLMLEDERLAELAARIADIPHVRRLRVHTRMPVAIPARVTDALLSSLTATRLRPVLVVHANHPNEIDGDTAAALERLGRARIPLLNQAVLLAGVNDRAATLIGLSERLFTCGVVPYYVHLLDPVAGAAHFDTPAVRAPALAAALRAALPGYLVPRFVREVPGVPAKMPIL